MVKVTSVIEPIEIQYEKSQASQSVSAKDELDKLYDVKLTTEQKINTLKFIVVELNKELSKTSNRTSRIAKLSLKQTLEECIDILEKYYAVQRAKEDESSIDSNS